MPKFFPLVSLTFGYWASRLHMKDQMFLMIQKNKFIYVVVHPPKQPKTPKNQSRQFSKTFRENFNSSENHQTNNFFSTNSEKQQEFDKDSYYDSFYLLNKKKILKLFGNKNPFTTVTDMKGGRQDVDFYGVVTFEVEFKEIVGMGYVNNHMRGHNRIVLEARTIIKKSFENVEDFYGFYYQCICKESYKTKEQIRRIIIQEINQIIATINIHCSQYYVYVSKITELTLNHFNSDIYYTLLISIYCFTFLFQRGQQSGLSLANPRNYENCLAYARILHFACTYTLYDQFCQ